MARISGVEPREAGWLTRLIYRFIRGSIHGLTGQDRLPESAKIVAHDPALLRAVGRMEMAQRAASSVDRRLKHLAGLRVATLAGCPA
jgi:hypothetical protein